MKTIKIRKLIQYELREITMLNLNIHGVFKNNFCKQKIIQQETEKSRNKQNSIIEVKYRAKKPEEQQEFSAELAGSFAKYDEENIIIKVGENKKIKGRKRTKLGGNKKYQEKTKMRCKWKHIMKK